MDLTTLQPLLDWIQNHPGLAGLAVFAIAALESLAVVGIFVPGVVFMLGIGALVGLGVLDLTATVLWTAAGAVVGDGLSYWLGRHFDKRLRSIWPFTKHPELIPRGERFFHKHGGKSVLFGRFIGPIRPIIPAIAGIMHMNPYHFYFVNVLSAIAWAPVVLLPGVVFGSSLHLAMEVAVRLVVIIILMLAIAWMVVVGLRTMVTPVLLRLFGRWESHWDFVVRNAVNSGVVLLVLLLAAGGYYDYSVSRQTRHTLQPLNDETLWWQSAWQTLPVYREKGDQEDPLTVQWWGDAKTIQASLQRENWHFANTLSIKNAIMWLSPSPQIELLPLVSHRFNGKREAFLTVKKLDDHRQLILRIWPALRSGIPLHPSAWVATVSLMELKQPYPTYFYASINQNVELITPLLLGALPSTSDIKKVVRKVSDNKWNGSVILIKAPLSFQ